MHTCLKRWRPFRPWHIFSSLTDTIFTTATVPHSVPTETNHQSLFVLFSSKASQTVLTNTATPPSYFTMKKSLQRTPTNERDNVRILETVSLVFAAAYLLCGVAYNPARIIDAHKYDSKPLAQSQHLAWSRKQKWHYKVKYLCQDCRYQTNSSTPTPILLVPSSVQ